jgi:hypothetical protein
MRSQIHFQTKRGSHHAWLYSFVFTKKLSVLAVSILFVSFFIQPFHQALANEATAPSDEAVLPEAVAEQLPEVKSDMVESDSLSLESSESLPDDVPPEEVLPEQNVDSYPAQAVEETIDTQIDSDELVTDVVQVDSVVSLSDDVQNSTSSDELLPIASDSESAGGSSDSTQEPEEIFSSDDLATETTDLETVTTDSNADTNATSDDVDEASSSDFIDKAAIETEVNDLVGSVVNEVVTLTRQMVTEENFYQFSRQSCVAVGDGTFHCTTKEKPIIDPTSAVYAEKDETGDMEIYMRTGKGEVKQLTDNDSEDTSPDVDLTSMRAVWQRLIDGRYQIISYDLEERKETQLTFSRTNSMEPKVSEEGIVWQAWDGNDWEVIFFDGQFTDQITDNDVQDVTPVIEDGYVLWSVLGGTTAEARVYSIKSGELMTITGHEGGAVANPRFVLVYDTKFDNGDVVTQGFDPVTGLATPLASKPAELPFTIPEPDPVGEIRALINNKSTQKEKEIVTVPVTTDGGDLNLSTTSATSSDTLILNSLNDLGDEAVFMSSEIQPDFELTEYDLVITKEASSTNSVLNKQFYLGTSTAPSVTSVEL